MKILLYIQETDPFSERLERLVRSKVPEDTVEVCQSFEGLVNRLKNPLDWRSLAVLLAADQEDLRQIVSIKRLFGDLRLIVIAPDEESSTISIAHQLRPRFLGSLNGDFSMIQAVLSRMLETPH